MASLTHEQLKVLEQTRQRLVQLTQSLGSLANSINQSDPLPAWSSLQSQATILSNNLLSISHLLTAHQPLLSSLVAYPTPLFPGRAESTILHELLRTKLEPRVEEWVARGRRVGARNNNNNDATTADAAGGLSVDELRELWRWAPVAANMEARRRDWGGDYTLEERERGVRSVVTGLRRRLDEGVDDDEEEEEEEEGDGDGDEEMMQGGGDMEVVVGGHARGDGARGGQVDIAGGNGHGASKSGGNGMALDDVFRYMMTGAPPRLK
ncbi:mediator of RNA polymerase II transcription subunit 8 [Emydomyces testavorans]|uniref:Mediator of RNA polymerase II transcription subunit 8 n=1 Tax=Emydomyces testavorans TaxID=2070801 RepID=A0AAF0IIU6_9EURO|nr:mediator of RNA polymerase II transcription subunit 8 [Emydomyces testavorans]